MGEIGILQIFADVMDTIYFWLNLNIFERTCKLLIMSKFYLEDVSPG